MNQPKIERVLRLMKLMSGTTYFSVNELAEKMNTSYRSIYRYIDTFKQAGFVVEKVHDGFYRIMKMPKDVKNIDNLVYFSEEEASIVHGLIQGLSGTNSFKANLQNKLSAIYDITAIDRYAKDSETAYKIECLKEAVENRRQVILKQYSSSNSGTAHDILIEPYEFAGEYAGIYAYDVKRKENRIYKVVRIGAVEETGKAWENEADHKKGVMDVFRMISHKQTPVTLELTRRAMNLLVEEYPMAEKDLVKARKKGGTERWLLKTQVSAMEGVGRFVIGLAGDVRIIDSPALSEYVRDFVRDRISLL